MDQTKVKEFFLRTMLYLSPILLMMLGMEILQRKLPNDYSYKKQQLESKLGEIETLILGTSHTYMGINPSLFEGEAFNLASTAQTLYFDRFLFEKYHQDMPNLKRLILPISYSSLGSESYLNPGAFNKSYHFAYFYGSDAFIKKLAPRRFSLVSLFSVKRSVDRSLAYYRGEDDLVECDEKGWYQGNEAPKELERSGETTGALHDQFYDEELIPQNIQYVTDIIEACQAAGIDIYLLSTPMYKSYMDHVKEDRYQLMLTNLDSLSSRHKVPYLNFTFDNSYEAQHFFDSNHLNEEGADMFTQKLIDQIKSLEAQKVMATEIR